MTNPTLERAARAAAKANEDEQHWEGYFEIVRAVLMAVREPDEAMSIAGYSELSDDPIHADFDCAWRAGVDAILE